MNIQIVILQRGWVFVGDLTQNGTECTLRNGYNVRRWGTSYGLGELADKGPLAETKLDPVKEISFHELAVIAKIKCSSVWEAKCLAQ